LKKIHIISFDYPDPPIYGGIIDIYWKIVYLRLMGVYVILHAFVKDTNAEYNFNIADQVFLYPRKPMWRSVFSSLPFIVDTRRDAKLLTNLLQDDAPILFEGLHTTFLINNKAIRHRRKIYRESNIEHDYYHALYLAAASWWQRLYYKIESKRLYHYEKILQYADVIISVSSSDQRQLQIRYPNAKHIVIYSFHPYKEFNQDTCIGTYNLFHGNLSVAENENALNYLLDNIVPSLKIPLIVAGKNPSEAVRIKCRANNVTLIANPSQEKMEELISRAQVLLLYTDQATGLKLKLLISYYIGRHIVSNSKMLVGTPLEGMITSCDTNEAYIHEVNKRSFVPFDKNKDRIVIDAFDNKLNASLLYDMIDY